MKTLIPANVSPATIKRISAQALLDEAKSLRKSVRKLPTGDANATIVRALVTLLEQRSQVLLLEAETLDQM